MEKVFYQEGFEEKILVFSFNVVGESSLDEKEESQQEPEQTECNGENTEENCVDGKFLFESTRESNFKKHYSSIGFTCCHDGANNCGIKSGSIIKNHERCRVLIQSLLQTTIDPEKISHKKSSMACDTYSASAQITIYYYKTDIAKDLGKGAPVVLNFSGSNNFLKCYYEGDKAFLIIECCEKTKLESICKDDPTTWPFVFYMSTKKDVCRRFESASCSGWFIHTKPSGMVCMDKDTNQNLEESFFSIFPSFAEAPGKSM